MMNSKLMTGLGETKTKILKKLRNPVPLYMSLKDSDEKVNNKTTYKFYQPYFHVENSLTLTPLKESS